MLRETAEKGLEKNEFMCFQGRNRDPGFPPQLRQAGGSICGHLQFNRRRREGGRGKWQFVSQGLFRLRQTNPKPLPPGPGNSWDRENLLLQSGACRRPVSARPAPDGVCSPTRPPGRAGGRATGLRDPRRGQPCAPPAQGEGSPMHSARWDVNPRPECQPQRRHSEEPRVTEGRDRGGDKGVVAGEHNESKGVQRSCSAPESGDPAPRSPCDMGTGGRGRGCCTWTSALEYTCQPGNR